MILILLDPELTRSTERGRGPLRGGLKHLLPHTTIILRVAGFVQTQHTPPWDRCVCERVSVHAHALLSLFKIRQGCFIHRRGGMLRLALALALRAQEEVRMELLCCCHQVSSSLFQQHVHVSAVSDFANHRQTCPQTSGPCLQDLLVHTGVSEPP